MNEHLQQVDAVDQAIMTRRSVRRFLDQPVDRNLVEQILEVAARAPSGTNLQPWQVDVITGNLKQTLTNEILKEHFNPENDHQSEFLYYPEEFFEPYRSRRKKVGLDLYGLLNIEKGAIDKMKNQHGRNYQFFDAPVGLIFSIDKRLKIGSWLDYGMFLQNIMIAARARGLDTCPQVAFAQYHRIIRKFLNIDEGRTIICGMSLGYADLEAIENTLVTERVPPKEFAKFHED